MSDEQVPDTVEGNTLPSTSLPTPAKKKFRWWRMLFTLLFLGFVVIQFFQPDKNNNDVFTQQDISSVVSLPDTVQHLLKIACYDCHSNNTNYPWYTNIQPGGWWMANHVEEGKQHLNFNEFANMPAKNGKSSAERQDHKLDEIKQTINKGEMPLNSYLWIHSESKLTQQQKKLITDWTDSARKELTRLSEKNKKQ